MSLSRASYRFRVALPARWHEGEGAVDLIGVRADTLDLSRDGVGLLCAEPPEVGRRVRVVMYQTVDDRPLARQWSGTVTHAHFRADRARHRVGIAFDWPNGRGARPRGACPRRCAPPWPGVVAFEESRFAGLFQDRRALSAAAGGFVVDQATKLWADGLTGDVFDLIPGWLGVATASNAGALANFAGAHAWTSPACALAGLAALGFWALDRGAPPTFRTIPLPIGRALGAGLVAAGVLGNSADRLALGHVRDFLVAGVLPHWTFNVADVLLVTGALVYLTAALHHAIDIADPLD